LPPSGGNSGALPAIDGEEISVPPPLDALGRNDPAGSNRQGSSSSRAASWLFTRGVAEPAAAAAPPRNPRPTFAEKDIKPRRGSPR
jgi:hypothetical protein